MVDLISAGPIFIDLSFSGLPESGPVLGEEIYAQSVSVCCGGAANVALAGAKLGLDTVLVSDCGDDQLSQVALAKLADSGVKLSLNRYLGWATPTTVLLNYRQDRAMVTCQPGLTQNQLANCQPAPETSKAKVVVCSITANPMAESILGEGRNSAPKTAQFDPATQAKWLAEVKRSGSFIILDSGTDPSGRWDLSQLAGLETCDLFTPNIDEAKRYTGYTDIADILSALLEYVPAAVVTMGAAGAAGMVRGGELVRVKANPVEAIDTGGAGEIFNACLAKAKIAGWSFAQAVDFAVRVSEIAVAKPGGGSSCPSQNELTRLGFYANRAK